jgi:hypothetical protein
MKLKKLIMRLCSLAVAGGLGILYFNKISEELHIFDKLGKLFWSRTAIVGCFASILFLIVIFAIWILTDKDKN